MTNTEQRTFLPLHTMNLLYRLAVRSLGVNDSLAYESGRLIRVQRRLPSGRTYVVSLWNLPVGGCTFDRYICGGPYYTNSNPNICEGVAHLLRLPIEGTDADRIAAVHESFEICEAEAYWPTDFRIAHPDER